MRYIKLDKEQQNVPVLKNVVYALRLMWNTDKKLIIGYFMQEFMYGVFSTFIRNVLFLKILLEIITGNRDFSVYVRCLLLFAAISVLCKVVSFAGMKIEKKRQKMY